MLNKNGETVPSVLDIKHCASQILGVAPEQLNIQLKYEYNSQYKGKTPLRYYYSIYILKVTSSATINFKLLKSNIQVPFSIAPVNECSYVQVPFFADEIYPLNGLFTGLFYEFTII